MSKADLLQAYSELAYICGIVDTVIESHPKVSPMWQACDQRLTHAGNVLHNLLLTYDEPEPEEDRWEDLRLWIEDELTDTWDGSQDCTEKEHELMKRGMRRVLLKMRGMQSRQPQE